MFLQGLNGVCVGNKTKSLSFGYLNVSKNMQIAELMKCLKSVFLFFKRERYTSCSVQVGREDHFCPHKPLPQLRQQTKYSYTVI